MDLKTAIKFRNLPEEVVSLITSQPAKGTRRDTLLDIANHCGFLAWTNHEIADLYEEVAVTWGVWSLNKFAQYETIRSVIRNVRSHYDEAGNTRANTPN